MLITALPPPLERPTPLKQTPRISSDCAWHRMRLFGLTATIPIFSSRDDPST